MTTIDQRITNNWPVTDGILRVNVPAYTAAVEQAIQDAIVTLWSIAAPTLSVPVTVESDPLPIQQQVADMATLVLIPVARDYYMQTKITQSANVQHGGGSVSESTYNKIAALDSFAQQLRDRIDARMPLIIELLTPSIPDSSSPLQGDDVPGLCAVEIRDTRDPMAALRGLPRPQVNQNGETQFATGYVGDIPGPVTRVLPNRRNWPY